MAKNTKLQNNTEEFIESVVEKILQKQAAQGQSNVLTTYNETIPIRDEDNICGGVRVVRETTSVQHISYDGMKTSLPVKMPEKWTGTIEQLNDFLWENRHNL